MPALSLEPLADSLDEPLEVPCGWPQLSCDACGATWEQWDDDADGPLKCPKCGHVRKVGTHGIWPLRVGDLGKALGKCSWCSKCRKLTLNVPGKTYSGQPIEQVQAEHIGRPLYGDVGGGPLITAENIREFFFGCAECGAEKFWAWGYHCPRCDYDHHAVIEVGEPRYSEWAAYEWGGHPQDWEEFWVCLLCGHRYWIGNANY